MASDVKRSSSKGDIDNLLKDIQVIVKDNKETFAELKAIKQKNDEMARTNKRVDIPSIVSGKKRSEIDIPHKRQTKNGETQSEINKRSKYTKPEEMDNSSPITVSVGTFDNVESEPPKPPVRGPRNGDSDRESRSEKQDETDDRKLRRAKSVERKRTLEAIRNKHRSPIPAEEAPEGPPQVELGLQLPVRSELPRKRRDVTSDPLGNRGSPEPQGSRKRSPDSPRRKSPDTPRKRSPVDSPRRKSSDSPRRKSPDSPRRRSPEATTPRRRVRSPDEPTRNGKASRPRTRKESDKESEVEIFPEFIEEDFVESEVLISPSTATSRRSRPANSSPSSSLSGSGPKKRHLTETTMSPNGTVKRTIVLEKCSDCGATDSSPGIEIRICSREKCEMYRTPDLDIIPSHTLSLYANPPPPQRSSSLNRIPQPYEYEPPLRAMSPCAMEVERMTRRLNRLKEEVDNVIRECKEDITPVTPRETAHAIQTDSPTDKIPRDYSRDNTTYYRARYHSTPQSPTGQSNKTTSTTDILNYNQVYYPAKEEMLREEEREREVIYLSTHSIDLPSDDGMPFEIEEDALGETAAAPFTPFPRSYDNDFEPECDLTESPSYVDLTSSRVYIPKREEELLTPPPIPPRSGNVGDITLRGDNLFDPFHIGTTYVVLSKQNHGRFKFQTPDDPNTSAPPSPKVKPQQKHEVPVVEDDGPSPLITPTNIPPVNTFAPKPRKLYQPKMYDIKSGSVISLTSAPAPNPQIDHNDSFVSSSTLTSPVPAPSEVTSPTSFSSRPPPLPARNSAKPMSPDKRLGFNRPQKGPATPVDVYREVPVDCGVGAPPDAMNSRKPSLHETPPHDRKNPVSRAYHLQTIANQEDEDVPRRATWSTPSYQDQENIPRSDSLPNGIRPYTPNSNTLRRKIPHVRFLGNEWKELAQRLGYDNSFIACFTRDFPDPGLAFLDHWSRQQDSRIEDLLYHLKALGLWKTAETLDRTFDTTNV